MDNKRILFLKKLFKVCSDTEFESMEDKELVLIDEKNIGYYEIKEKSSRIRNIGLSEFVFNCVIDNDPTPNKEYSQWMLTLIVQLIRIQNLDELHRFVFEDLATAGEYLEVFHKNKMRKDYKETCKNHIILRNIKNISNINEYNSLSLLFDAVDPFVVKEFSTMEKIMESYAKKKMAEIMHRDREYTVYSPLTLQSSVIFGPFASWCTARKGNSNFETYTKTKRPNNTKSRLYIVIDNKFFKGNDENTLFQIHFESRQFHGKNNSDATQQIKNILDKSKNLREFFGRELSDLSNMSKKIDNTYISYIKKLKLGEYYVRTLPKMINSLELMNYNVLNSIDLRGFPKLNKVFISNCNIDNLVQFASNTDLEVLSLPNNRITTIPDEIGSLKKLAFLNLYDNKIIRVSDSLEQLDPAKGGSLLRITFDDKVSVEVINQIKEKLPNVEILRHNGKD